MKAAGSSLLCCTGTRAHCCHICTGTGAHPTHVHRTTSNFKIHRTCTSTWGAGAYAGQCASVETSPGCKSNSIFIPIPVRDVATAGCNVWLMSRGGMLHLVYLLCKSVACGVGPR
jgi:hypothetical protein